MRFIALIKSSAVRDVQFARTVDPDPLDDSAWGDLPEAEVFLKIINADTPEAAAEEAAEYGMTAEENIRLIAI